MRALLLMTAAMIVGCASQPPAPASGPVAVAPGVEAQRLAQAKNLNLKVVNKDGQQLFCRSNYITTSHIQRDTTCYTGDQLDKMEAQQQREVDQLKNTPQRYHSPFSPN